MDNLTKGHEAEPGNLFFEWSRSPENPSEYVLVEAFQDDAAEAHAVQIVRALAYASLLMRSSVPTQSRTRFALRSGA